MRSCCFANLGHIQTNPDICETAYFFYTESRGRGLWACLHGGGRPHISEVTCGRSPHLQCKRDKIKMKLYGQAGYLTDLSPPPPCNQALKAPERGKKQFGFGVWIHWFRVDGRPIRVKKGMQFQKYLDSCGRSLKLLVV